SDATLLRWLLADVANDPHVEFSAAGGWSGADSFARSLRIVGRGSVALVVDSDTTDSNLVEERRRFLQHSLREVRPGNDFLVVVIAPEIEGLLFRDRELL